MGMTHVIYEHSNKTSNYVLVLSNCRHCENTFMYHESNSGVIYTGKMLFAMYSLNTQFILLNIILQLINSCMSN